MKSQFYGFILFIKDTSHCLQCKNGLKKSFVFQPTVQNPFRNILRQSVHSSGSTLNNTAFTVQFGYTVFKFTRFENTTSDVAATTPLPRFPPMLWHRIMDPFLRNFGTNPPSTAYMPQHWRKPIHHEFLNCLQ